MLIRDLLDKISQKVYTISSHRTVEDVIEKMVRNGISAIIVMDGKKPVGIFAERDVIRCHLKERTTVFNEIKIENAMTRKLIVTEPDEKISTALSMMIKADIRHLPVVENKKIIAMLTINEIVKNQLGTLTKELHYLHDYIADLQEASED